MISGFLSFGSGYDLAFVSRVNRCCVADKVYKMVELILLFINGNNGFSSKFFSRFIKSYNQGFEIRSI